MAEVFSKGQFCLHQAPSEVPTLKIFPAHLSTSDFEPKAEIKFAEIDEVNKRCRWQLNTTGDQLLKDDTLALGCLALDYIFEKLQLKKVQVELLATEVTAIEFHRRLGFCEEGRLARQIVKDDKAWDIILMAHFKESWDKKRKLLEPVVTGEALV